MQFTKRLIGLGFAAVALQVAHGQAITILINHDPVGFDGQGPMMRGDRVLVPLRGVLEKMGVHVRWDPETQTVTAHKEGTDVKLHIGDNTASVNGKPYDLDVPALIIHGSTMVPLRFVGETLGNRVHWDPTTYTVNIEPKDRDMMPEDGHHRHDRSDGHSGDDHKPPTR